MQITDTNSEVQNMHVQTYGIIMTSAVMVATEINQLYFTDSIWVVMFSYIATMFYITTVITGVGQSIVTINYNRKVEHHLDRGFLTTIRKKFGFISVIATTCFIIALFMTIGTYIAILFENGLRFMVDRQTTIAIGITACSSIMPVIIVAILLVTYYFC